MGKGSEWTLVQGGHRDGSYTWKDAQHHWPSERFKLKTTLKYHLTPVRMATINKSINNKCWWGCGEKDNLEYLVGMQTGAATVENSMEFP